MAVHLLNRAVRRATIFPTSAEYHEFERVLAEVHSEIPLRILAFCVMPNHWHFVVWPETHEQVAEFMHRLTLTHALRWLKVRGILGTGHVYQGRFKAFPIQSDEHALLRCTRYVERNALRAGLVERAADWRWGSVWHRNHGDPDSLLTPGPVPLPPDWDELVDTPQTEAELADLRRCVNRGSPYGSADWVAQAAKQLGLESTLRPRGRPKKSP